MLPQQHLLVNIGFNLNTKIDQVFLKIVFQVTTLGIIEIDVCSLELDQGNCDNQTERWFYDSKTQECKKFTYRGFLINFKLRDILVRFLIDLLIQDVTVTRTILRVKKSVLSNAISTF